MVLFILAVVILAMVFTLYQRTNMPVCRSKKRLDGKTAIVTGGTTGMGLETAVDFAERGARVIIACPFENEGTDAMKYIIDRTGNNNVYFKLLDLASLKSVRAFAGSIIDTENRLDILVNNAGVFPPDFITEDGMSFVMQVNYFGHFLLTILLLPLLKASGKRSDPSRIVNLSSVMRLIARLNFDNLNSIGGNLLREIQIYGNSKLCLMLFSRELTDKLINSDVVINCVDPGIVSTKVFHTVSTVLGGMFRSLGGYMFKNPWEGAQTTIYAAIDDETGKVSGQFFKNCKLSKSPRAALDMKFGSILWEQSIKLVRLSSTELNSCLGVI